MGNTFIVPTADPPVHVLDAATLKEVSCVALGVTP